MESKNTLTSQKKSFFLELPTEMRLEMLSYCSLEALAQFSRVSKQCCSDARISIETNLRPQSKTIKDIMSAQDIDANKSSALKVSILKDETIVMALYASFSDTDRGRVFRHADACQLLFSKQYFNGVLKPLKVEVKQFMIDQMFSLLIHQPFIEYQKVIYLKETLGARPIPREVNSVFLKILLQERKNKDYPILWSLLNYCGAKLEKALIQELNSKVVTDSRERAVIDEIKKNSLG